MFSTNFIAMISENPSWSEAFLFLGYGFGVVMGALAMLWFCTAIMGKIFSAINAKPKAAVAPVAAPVAAASAPAADDNKLIAVISAAVHHTVGSGYRVTKVIRTGSASTNWSAEGRRQHHGSHRIR